MRLDLLREDLKNHLKKNNISGRELAESLGLSNSTISRILCSKGKTVDTPTMITLAHHFGKQFANYLGTFTESQQAEGKTTLDKIRSVIRRDPNISDTAKESLVDLMEVSYTHLAF